MTATATEPVEQVTEEPVARSASAPRMFKYSEYVDVGEGAADCEHARDGQCTDIEHFHAWCRLPNPYQHQDIREKGLAAKARKIRELRDSDSDASVILDEELAGLADERFRDMLIDELLASDWTTDYMEAQREAVEREEFKRIDQDREEFNRLQADAELPEEEQSEDFKRLAKHLADYVDAVREALKAVQEPKRAQYQARSIEGLIEAVRSRRVAEASDQAFLETYNPWTWFVGTFKVATHPTLGRPHIPMWEEIGRKDKAAAGTMYGEAPEVVETLRRVFNELQVALQRGSSGN